MTDLARSFERAAEPERARPLAQLGELVPEQVYRHPLRTDLYWARLK